MKILRVKKTNLYDIFYGQGWNNHSRVLFHNGFVKPVNGLSIPKHKLADVSSRIAAFNNKIKE